MSLVTEEFHGDGEAVAYYFVSETATYRVDEHGGEPEDGAPIDC